MSEPTNDSHVVARKVFVITMGGAALFAAIVFTMILPNW